MLSDLARDVSQGSTDFGDSTLQTHVQALASDVTSLIGQSKTLVASRPPRTPLCNSLQWPLVTWAVMTVRKHWKHYGECLNWQGYGHIVRRAAHRVRNG